MDLKVKQWVMKAKMIGKCNETGKNIQIGEEILYLPPVKNVCSGRVFCKESKTYKDSVKNIAHTGWKK